jgi:fucose 4-O-acetylase-like acetyltransferase
MQLFFFISGFFMYKEQTYRAGEIIDVLKKRFVQLIIPTIVFGFLYAYVTNRGVDDMLFIDSKSGYWYTYVLFIFISLYMLFSGIKWNIRLICMIVVAISVYGLSIYVQHHYNSDRLISLLSIQRWWYILYFVEGMIVKRYYHLFEKHMESKVLSSILVILFFFFVVFYDLLYRYLEFPLRGSLIQLSYSSISVLLVMSFCYKYRVFFSGGSLLSKWIAKVGNRTLDIYMIHFFFIPLDLSIIAHVLSRINGGGIIEFAVTSILALLIMFVSYFTGTIIRLSPLLSHYLLGDK